MKGRVLNIAQFEKNPRTCEVLWPDAENKITNAIEKHSSIKKWAWVCHDKDVYTEDDEKKCMELLEKEYDAEIQKVNSRVSAGETKEGYVKRNQYIFAGKKKGKHWHVVLWIPSKVDTASVAEWLSIPENQIDVPTKKSKSGRGRTAESTFLDCVEYLTHEKEKDKFRYPDEMIHSNFEWRKDLNERKSNFEKYGVDVLTPKEKLRIKVLKQGMTLKQACEEDPLTFCDDMATLQKARGMFLSMYADLPNLRINFFICGKSGYGKGVLSQMLASALFPNLPKDEAFFWFSKTSNLNGYDGQPVVIYDDFRGYEMIKKLGGRGNVFNMLDTHPKRINQDVKYSTTRLVNRFSIINGIEDYDTFFQELTGGHYIDNEYVEFEDANQAQRRIPIIICLHSEDFEILLNKGFFEGTSEFEEYFSYKRIVGNFGRLRKELDDKGFKEIGMKMINPILDKVEDAKIIETSAKASVLDFENYGKPLISSQEDTKKDNMKYQQENFYGDGVLIDTTHNYYS